MSQKPFSISAVLFLILFSLPVTPTSAQVIPDAEEHKPTAAYQWLDIMLETSAREVDRIGARPTILSRQMGITVTAMYDAWAVYDDIAVGTMLGGELRRPKSERTIENKETAIAYAMYRSCLANSLTSVNT